MLSEAHQKLMPSAKLRQELAEIIKDNPQIYKLASSQSNPKFETLTVLYTKDESGKDLCHMLEIPIPTSPGKIWVSRLPGYGRQAPLEPEIAALVRFGIQAVFCLLPEMDIADPDLYDVPGYVAAARQAFGENFHVIEVIDYEAPANEAVFVQNLELAEAALAAGKQIFVHCGAGCGRAGVFVACLLMRSGLTPDAAVKTFRQYRGCGPESADQVAYVFRLAAQQSKA